MSTNGMERLHSFLSDEGRELVNVKFFPGTDRGLSSERVAREADAALRRAFVAGVIDEPPVSERQQTSF